MLAIRLGVKMDKLISPNQSAFLKEIMLVDGVVAINEVIDVAKRSKRHCLILKLDFEKAYGSFS